LSPLPAAENRKTLTQFVTRTNAPHAPEHVLEVELPFLQTVLPSFQVVPLVVGDVAPQDVALVLARLFGGPETLIVVSWSKGSSTLCNR
jgi:AmmeMemoRadiSam system protein B